MEKLKKINNEKLATKTHPLQKKTCYTGKLKRFSTPKKRFQYTVKVILRNSLRKKKFEPFKRLQFGLILAKIKYHQKRKLYFGRGELVEL